MLTELGDPDKLAAGYTDRPLWLIGPRYYLDVVAPAEAAAVRSCRPCAAFGVALGQTLAGAPFGEIVGTVVPSCDLASIVHIGFWTTLVFAIVERIGAGARDAGLVGDVDARRSCPSRATSGAGFSDLVASLVFLAIAAGAILWDHFDRLRLRRRRRLGCRSSTPGLWPWWIGGAASSSWRSRRCSRSSVYAKGRWDIRLADGQRCSSTSRSPCRRSWLLAQRQLINPEFFPTVIPADSAADGDTDRRDRSSGSASSAIAAWDIVDAFLKARRAR